MIKTIMVPLDGTDRSAQVLDTALVVAGRFDAHIKAVHVREHGKEPFVFTGVPKKMREQYVEMNEKMVGSLADTVNEQFKAFCAQNDVRITRKPSSAPGISASLHVLTGDARSELARVARLADVVAMGRPYQHRIGGLGFGELHEAMLLMSGRPVLIVPQDWRAHRADRAAIGWNDSVEASRAVALTLPWLVQMKKVTVIVSKQWADSADDVVDYLKRHGCKADHAVIPGRGNIARSMLGVCDDVGAEFLVVGGFSRTRARQRLFGGVTSYLLENTDVITVMAH